MRFPAAFSENHPRKTARLSERYDRIISPNLGHIEGKRVLDLAANNGRWAWAAAEAGAVEAVAVEGRAETIAAGAPHAGPKVRFVEADIFDFLWGCTERFDTILCLGVFYHVLDHHMLLRLMTRLRPGCIIIDSGFIPSFDREVRFVAEDTSLNSSAIGVPVVGVISLGLLAEIADALGYRAEPIVWSGVKEPMAVRDYVKGSRFTVRLTPGRLDMTAWRDGIAASGLDVARIVDRPLAAREAADAARQQVRVNKFERRLRQQF